MPGQTSPLESLGIAADLELTKVIDIAGHVGDITGDEVNVSYTSLLIGLLWSDDPTSLWLQAEIPAHDVRLDAVYRHRSNPEHSRDAIIGRVATGTPYTARKDVFSVSARTVLQEATSIARETHLLPSEPIGTRHVAAVFFFRNPPGHDRQLHIEWGFDTETWRRAFARFIGRQYTAEAPQWSELLTGYVDTEPRKTEMPGAILGSYVFDPPAIRVLRTAEESTARASSTVLTSELLLRTMAAIRTEPDCASLAELVAKRLRITTVETLVEDTTSFSARGAERSVSRGVKNILDRARTLTRSITGSERIGTRHIIASMLLAPDSTANRRLVAVGVSVPLLRQKLLKDFSRRWVNDDGIQWRFHLIGLTPPTVAGFNSDDAEKGDDRLDVARYAMAFAVVIAADKVTPPLSIGIFGDWGSGKSFFMRLMQEQTQKVVTSGATDVDGQPLFCRRVVPIRFNAWHYADRNLWATLVQTIFQGLRAAMVGDREDSELMDKVIAKLEVTRIARKEAEERVRLAQEAQKTSEAELRKVRADLAQKAVEINIVKTKDVIAELRKTVLTDAQLDYALTVAQTYLGIKGVPELIENERKTTGQVIDLVNESLVVTARSRSALDWLLRAPVRPELITLAVMTLLVLGASAFIAIKYRAEINAAWPLISAAFVQGATVVALGVAWARRHLSTISRGLDQFDVVRAQLDARVATQRTAADTELAQAEAAQRAALETVAQAQAELDMARQAVETAEREAAESRSAHRIAQLVEQRITGKQYERYLGIVDAIRKDFQTLTDLMKQLRRERWAEQSDGTLPIDRIVLYIDDLDRCPSSKVVSVLEAIHLLLAFELFVVVVGVDVRWAARSLAERYPRHLSTGKYQGATAQATSKEGATAQDGMEEGASALDYLEKIFQIPFWLPPMDEQASRNMIAELVPRPKEANEVRVEGDTDQSASSTEPATTADNMNVDAPPEVEPQGTASVKAEPLLIESEERSFMLSLAEAVGKSPRRLKRFVNSYRIFKGSIDALARETFVLDAGRRGEYRAAMTLLALVTGAPRSSLALLQHLAEQNDDEALSCFTGKVSGLVAGEEASYVQAALQAYDTATADKALTVRELRHWMPLVTRFSFRSGSW